MPVLHTPKAAGYDGMVVASAPVPPLCAVVTPPEPPLEPPADETSGRTGHRRLSLSA